MSNSWFLGKTISELTRKERKRLRAELRANGRGSRKEIDDALTVTKAEKRDELLFLATSYSSRQFYRSPEWKALRYRAIKLYGNTCFSCGASPRTGSVIDVDHIRPRSIYPELAFDISNLQILCSDCNAGKSNKDQTDWRGAEQKVILRKKVS